MAKKKKFTPFFRGTGFGETGLSRYVQGKPAPPPPPGFGETGLSRYVQGEPERKEKRKKQSI